MNIKHVVYSDNQGSGYIHNERNELEKYLVKKSVTINGCEIKVGEKTTLNGHFANPIEYIGTIDKNEMVFYIGAADGLYFFQSVFKIQEDRIFEMFSPISGRDFYYVNGIWK